MADQPTHSAEATRDESADEVLLTEMHEGFDYDTEEWREIREEGRRDMRCCAGDTWTVKERKAREDANRPCLALDQLSQYSNQLINDVRLHERAIHVTPIGDGANDDTARYRADLIRQIEYRSNAQQAYTMMFENTVQRSYGFLRIKPAYVSDTSRDQELFIEGIPNPDNVTVDADLKKPDGSDMTRAVLHERWRIKDFARTYPHAKVQSFTADRARERSQWMTADTIQIAEYWKVHKRERTLLHVQQTDGQIQALFKDEIKKGDPLAGPVVFQRTVETKTVRQYLTNGFEILKETEWPGKSIPIVCCFGKILYVDGGTGSKKLILSLFRLARDAAQLFNYYRTCEAELVGMTPKFPYFAYTGQLEDAQLLLLQKSLHEPIAVVMVKSHTDEAGPAHLLPHPSRQPFEPPIQALEVGAESARRDIQSGIGSNPLPSQAQRQNEKSGVALQRIEESAQRGSYHFIDHYEESITRCGAILNELIPHYYDAARTVTVREEDDSTKPQRINDPNPQNWPKGQDKPIEATRGEHDITLSTGPNSNSERETANDFADQLISNELVMQVVGPEAAKELAALAIKLKNIGPLGNKMAEIISPPKQEDENLPPQAQQAIAQAKALVQQLQQQLQEAAKIIQTKQVESDAKLKQTAVAGEAQLQKAQLDNATKVDIAKMELAGKLFLGRQQQGHEAAMAGAQSSHEQSMAAVTAELQQLQMALDQMNTERDQQAQVDAQLTSQAHEAGMASQGQEHEAGMAQMGHEQALEQQAAQPQPEAEA